MDRLLCFAQKVRDKKDLSKNQEYLEKEKFIDVIFAEYLESYKLLVGFSDGTERIIDFSDFLKTSLNPLIRKYLDIVKFKNFTTEYGDLFWDDYELCFPVIDFI
ncbi:hypothetical protein MTBBW1_1060005 [Desulfamplus magnetovallimortis]|uniref:DUF2442 domain-containing protein n=1 Tax=Desulfamplus magnetovallimortis TaxID=1246637 RepID=A0A1W1H5D3_9BACT|nr:DUF2442 domain-containing protein [Desulfamplus magnetovallimortis]SLM27654.1 hypothetical protein MTBBW1_1060005 [Desulfamplus magnetovallimortis]